jgi:hypothetical protein
MQRERFEPLEQAAIPPARHPLPTVDSSPPPRLCVNGLSPGLLGDKMLPYGE